MGLQKRTIKHANSRDEVTPKRIGAHRHCPRATKIPVPQGWRGSAGRTSMRPEHQAVTASKMAREQEHRCLRGEKHFRVSSLCPWALQEGRFRPCSARHQGKPSQGAKLQRNEASKLAAKSPLTAQQLSAPRASRNNSLCCGAEAPSEATCTDEGGHRGTGTAGGSASASLHETPESDSPNLPLQDLPSSGSHLAASHLERVRITQKARGETPPSISMGETTPWASGSRAPISCSTAGIHGPCSAG